MIGIVDLLITAERYQSTVRADRLANGLQCSLDYHHCFYQTCCSALAVRSNSCPVSTDQLVPAYFRRCRSLTYWSGFIAADSLWSSVTL